MDKNFETYFDNTFHYLQSDIRKISPPIFKAWLARATKITGILVGDEMLFCDVIEEAPGATDLEIHLSLVFCFAGGQRLEGALGRRALIELMPLDHERMEVTWYVHQDARSYLLGLLAEIQTRWPAMALDKERVETRRGMSEEREQRALKCKELKDAHPEWSRPKVAAEAALVLGVEVTNYDVRNDYNDMGWDWERADRIR